VEATARESKRERLAWSLGAIFWMGVLLGLSDFLGGDWVWRNLGAGATSPLPALAVAVAAASVAAYRGHRMHWRSASDLRAKLLSLSACLQALTGIGLGAFIATCAGIGRVADRSFQWSFDVLLDATLFSAPLVAVHLCLALWRCMRRKDWPSALWGPLLWATGPVTFWNLGLAFGLT